MKRKSLWMDDDDFIDFQIYGISSSITDPALFAFHFNSKFNTRFSRCKDLDLLTGTKTSYYPLFEWEDPETCILYHLIKNSAYTLNLQPQNQTLNDLFETSPLLISQFKEYNYFLKISGDSFGQITLNENAFIQKITKIEPQKIKSIDRLIF